MNFVRITFLNGDIETFSFNLLKGCDNGRLCIFDNSLNLKTIEWNEIYKVEIFRSEVE